MSPEDSALRTEPRRTARMVRPYVLTQGRTQAPEATFALEAPVRSLDRFTDDWRAPQRRKRAGSSTCARRPLSVAESRRGSWCPSVSRVCSSVTWRAADAVTVDVGAPDAANDVALLERLLDGIRAL